MLRLLVLILVLLNGTYYAWSHDLLRAYGFAPTQQSEPFRMAQQIRPELVRVLSNDEARKMELPAQTGVSPIECLQAGVFTDAQAAAIREAAQSALPAGSWLVDTAVEPARWIIYLGKYAEVQTLARKRAELTVLNVRFEPLTNPALELGLSLGGFDNEAAADEALAALGKRGVHTARVVQERAELRGSVLRIPAVDDAMRARLDGLKAVLGARPLRACR